MFKHPRLIIFANISALALVLITLCLFSQKYFISDSEYWALSLSQNFWGFEHTSFIYKFFFNLFLQISHLVTTSNVHHLLFARLLFSLCAGLSLIGVFYFVKNISSNPKTPWLASGLLAVTTLFYTEAIQIRSDNLVQMMLIWALWFLTENSKKISRTFILPFLILLLLFTTPKSILHLIVALVFFWQNQEFQQLNLKKQLVDTVKGYKWWGFLFLPLMYFSWPFFSSAVDYFRYNIPTFQSLHESLFNLHFKQFIQENLILCIGILVSLIVNLIKKRHASITMPALVAIIIILLYPNKLGFFIYSLLTFPLINLALFLNDFFSQRKILVSGFLVALILNVFYLMPNKLASAPNDIQIQSMNIMETYLIEHNYPGYTDGTGVLPLMKQKLTFAAPEHAGNFAEISSYIERPEAELFFWGNRYFSYFTKLMRHLEKYSYIHIGSGLYAKADILNLDNQQDLKKLTEHCKNSKDLHLYSGDNFTKIVHLGKLQDYCEQLLKNSAPYTVAVTRFSPFLLPDNKSFSKVFASIPD